MKRADLIVFVCMFLCSATVYAETNKGYMVTSDLWIRAVINTVEKGPVEAVWQKGGEDTTSRGDRVIWGHFYANPEDVAWGSRNNPDLYVKIWFDAGGRLDVNYFHVSVPDITVYSAYPDQGEPDTEGTTTMSRRYIRQYYENGRSYSEENYEDGLSSGGSPTSIEPVGQVATTALRTGAMINTVEKGPIEAIWRPGGQDVTDRGDHVIWGFYYADPEDVAWGSENNPDLFVKIWFDVSGRIDVNYFHVSVPDIDIFSDYPSGGAYDQAGKTVMANRYVRHEYQNKGTRLSVELPANFSTAEVTLLTSKGEYSLEETQALGPSETPISPFLMTASQGGIPIAFTIGEPGKEEVSISCLETAVTLIIYRTLLYTMPSQFLAELKAIVREVSEVQTLSDTLCQALSKDPNALISPSTTLETSIQAAAAAVNNEINKRYGSGNEY
jgi:hypothetical protein